MTDPRDPQPIAQHSRIGDAAITVFYALCLTLGAAGGIVFGVFIIKILLSRLATP